MEAFRRALEETGLADLGWRGNKYTWNNGHEGVTFIKERLDQVVANQWWRATFQEAGVEVLSTWVSDHKPLLVLAKEMGERRYKGKKFKYEMNWGMEEECGRLVEDVWSKRRENSGFLRSVQQKLACCRVSLRRWSRGLNKGREGEIKEKSVQLRVLEEEEGPNNMGEIKKLRGEQSILLDKEDLRWKQRVKKHWLANGDKNTKFFHACANQRRKKNTIKAVRDSQGRLVIEEKEIEGAF
ncbi:uncharacterized protein LOC122274492 [Carya illinoinensis]|uniref:uncharacterized protein LOC122274492 n=1 Tax=Carya illinoinensis TaxID=32201 RepID=UPI001C72679D|nr:uncharacterized protein LOC122274492 [Carya illinoinensis]